MKNKIEWRMFFPLSAILLTLLMDTLIPNHPEAKNRNLIDFRILLFLILIILVVTCILFLFRDDLRKKYAEKSWLWGGVILFLNVLNLVTVKFMLLPQVYFPSLNTILHVFVTDYAFLAKNMWSSFLLLLEGMAVGGIIGVITGIAAGWSKTCNYWMAPLIRFLGPIPSSTWVPLALVVFPKASWAAIFLIAFAVWFQMAILTCSGIQEVKKAYFEISSTLGASDTQNLFRIAIPGALPVMFLGLFNATCGAFVALMSAEMLGCDSGIGWYINWQKKMLAYSNVYAGILIIAVFCYAFLSLEMRSREKLLSWQKGVIKW